MIKYVVELTLNRIAEQMTCEAYKGCWTEVDFSLALGCPVQSQLFIVLPPGGCEVETVLTV